MSMHSSRDFLAALLGLALLLLAIPGPAAFAGGTPDPGTLPLAEDDELGADGDALPDNENQLLGLLGANRGFGFGDYVSDAASGLQSTLGTGARFQFFVEVPPGQTTLTVEIFDADIGAGDVAGSEEHDQNDNTPYDTSTTYELLDPTGASVATITLPPQDCDPTTAGQQTACNNTWSDLGTFTVANPDPGHWLMTVFTPDLAANQDDNNSFGLRAHDGDATAGGTEYNVYADTYVGIGQVFGSSIAPFPAFSRTHDLYPLISGFCSCDANDWDTDSDGDESTTYTPPRPPAGTPTSFTPTPASMNGNWGQDVISGFTTGTDATNYGLWDLRWITGAFNFITFYMGDESAADPAFSGPGGGASPDQQPEAGAIRLYLPADGSRFFGERGGADDVVAAPEKPWVGHSWALVAGEPDLTLGVTSRIEVTVTVDNPTAFPIQFDAATAGTDVLTAVVPTNGGQTVYVTGSATITGGTSTATAETGTGPWNLTFAPGVIAAGTTATLTYRIDVTPSGLGTLDITGAGLPTGTQGTYLDETCADAGGGSSACSAAAQTTATFEFGPLCELSAPVTGSVGAAKRVNSGPTDNLDGTFTVGFEILVENLGTEDLDMVQVVDNLATTFPSPATVTSVSAVVVTGTLVANGSFNGIGDTNLLDASMSTLAVGMTATASFTVTFDPNGLPGPFFNQATVSGDTPGGSTVTDPSDNGTDPDPNGNGNANEAGENDPTPIVVPENPSITVVKTAGAVTDAPTPGLFDVTYTLVTTNVGNVDLSSVQVTDDLSLTFPAPASVVSAGANCTAGSCGTVTVDYTGPADTTLLDASMSTLAVGASFTLELTVRFDPNGEAGPFSNQATSSGTSPQGSTVQDSDTASTAVSENPAITVAKTVATPMDVGGGAFTVVYSILATNTGNVDLDMLQLTDNLLVAFPAPANIVAASALCTAGSCGTVTVDFINPADTTLLDASASSLAVGQSVTIELTVTFNTGGGVGPFTNMVTASATSPLDANVQDDDDVDFSLGENPAISIVKTAGPVTDAPMLGEFDVTFTLVVTNTGDVNLTSLQVIDPIDLPFLPGDAVSSSVTCVAGSCGTVTIEYGGPVDFTLLDETMSSLAVGQSVTFELMARFRPFQFPGPFTNFASASGDSPLGTTVTDQDDADAAVPGNPGIDVVKTLDSLVDEGGGVFTATFSVDVSNTGNVLLLDVEILDDLTLTFPPPIVIQTVTPPTGGINLPPNPNFDGVGDTNLIAASPNPLLLNFTETFTFSVTFDRAGEPGPLDNVATGSGDSPQGVNVQDSDDAQITLPPVPAVPVIGLAKAVDGPVIDNGDGTLSVPFLFTVDNFGDVDLFDVQVTDDLSLTFPPPASVVSVTAPVASITVGTGALAANAAFDGVGDTDLLVAAGSTLDVGASGEIRFEVTFDPADETSFENSAIATADSADGPTSDTSDDGTNSDTDGDGNPDEDGENDPTPIELMPNPIEIPTLGPWGLVSLVSLLALLGVGLMRRRI